MSDRYQRKTKCSNYFFSLTQAVVRPVTLLFCQTLVFAGIYYWNIFYIANIFYVLSSLLPLIWMLGILPPPETFLLWLGEQIFVWILGGTPTSSTLNLILQLSAAFLQFCFMFPAFCRFLLCFAAVCSFL